MPFGSPPVPQGPWTAFTPTARAATPGATPPTFSVSAWYQVTGKRLDFSYAITVSAAGTGGGSSVLVGTPPGSSPARRSAGGGGDGQFTGKALWWEVLQGAAEIAVRSADAAYPASNSGTVLIFTGSYEIQ